MTEQSEKSIFLAAIEINPAAERAAFLSQACAGNEPLRAKIEALLQAHEKPLALLDASGVLGVTIDDPVSERPGTAIGPYKLMEQIGEGGMGLVFVAEQQQPVRRKVALKVIKPGMDTRQVVARFEAERQALALMDHPNIAKVFDGGTTGSGRPYFVMELVKGIPITDYCDRNQVSIRERLKLFLSVCQAVQHAHQKGIIHRDLKPSNVLVMSHDGTPVVKVIDFGVAKAIGQQLTDKTIYTQFSQMVGTPLYMSPEQAGMSGLDVDTRSDIYSLGVLLYELLTGSTPFDRKHLHEAGYDEIRRVIREEEPPKPSTRISTLGKAAITVSAQRQSDPKQLSRLIRGELDWIVMKALEKDRNRRYETASGLARDIERYLNDEAVQACPPSAGYRLRKFVRRNRTTVAAGSLLLSALMLGILGTTLGLFRARAAEALAREERDKAVAAEEQQRLALNEAEKNFRRARQVVDTMFTQVAEQWLEHKTGLEPVQKQFLQEAARFYEDFANERSSDPKVLLERANAYRRLGAIYHKLGESRRSEKAFQEANAILADLIGQAPADESYRVALGDSHDQYGFMLGLSERPRAALESHLKAVAQRERLVADFPENASYRRDLAISLGAAGNQLRLAGSLVEAEQAFRRSARLVEDLPLDLVQTPATQFRLGELWSAWGYLWNQKGQEDEALKYVARGTAIYEKLVADFPNEPMYRNELAGSYHVEAGLLSKTNPNQAEKLWQQSLAIEQRLLSESPSVPDYYHVVGLSQLSLGNHLCRSGRRDEATKLYRQAFATYHKLAADFSQSFRVALYTVLMFQAQKSLLNVLLASGRYDEAASVRQEALASLGELCARQFPAENPEAQLRLFMEQATLLDESGKSNEAEKVYRKALILCEGLPAEALADQNLRNIVKWIYGNFISLLNNKNRSPEAVEIGQKYLALCQKLATSQPNVPGSQLGMGDAEFWIGLQLHWGRPKEAEQHYRKALSIFEKLAAEYPNVHEHSDLLADCRMHLSWVLVNIGRIAEGEELCRQNVDFCKKRAREFPKELQPTFVLARSYYVLAMARQARAALKQAEQNFRQACTLLQQLASDFPDNPNVRSTLCGMVWELALFLKNRGQHAEAEKHCRRAIEIRQQLAAEPLTASWYTASWHREELRRQLRILVSWLGNTKESEGPMRKALAISEKLAADYPAKAQLRLDLAFSHRELALLLSDHLKNPREAEQHHRQALAVLEKLAADFPSDPQYIEQVGHSLRYLGFLLAQNDRAVEAASAFQRAVTVFMKLSAEHPEVPGHPNFLADSHRWLGLTLSTAKGSVEAERAFQQSLDSLEKIAPGPGRGLLISALSSCYLNVASFLQRKGQKGEVEKVYERAREFLEARQAQFPEQTEYGHELGRICNHFGVFLSSIGRHSEAEKVHRQALDLYEKLAKANLPQDRERWRRQELMWTQENFGRLFGNSGRPKEAEKAYRQAIALGEQLNRDFPNQGYIGWLVKHHGSLVTLFATNGCPEEVAKTFRKLLELNPQSAVGHNNFAWFLATYPESKFRDATQAVDAAKKAVELAPKEGTYWNTLGVAHYRAGGWKDAITALEKSMQFRKGGDSFDWFFLAMAQWQLGNKKEARAWYDKAVAWQEKNQPKNEELRRFREETAKLLEVKEKK